MDKSLEDQLKTTDMFMTDSGYRPHPTPQQTQDQHHMLNQMQMSEIALARSLNQYPHQYAPAPAQSPPALFQQQPMPHPMPPRPRPEGGQDPSPNFLNEELPVLQGSNFKNNSNKKEDLLVIDSWTGGPSPTGPEDSNENKFYGGMRPTSEDKEPTGWGAPPPTNPNGWGQPPPKIGNWHQPPPNVQQHGGPP